MWEVVDSKEKSESIIAERWECPVMQNPDVADDFLFAGRMTSSVIETLKTSEFDQETAVCGSWISAPAFALRRTEEIF